MGKTINKPIFKVAIKNNWKVTMIHLGVALLIWVILRLVAATQVDDLTALNSLQKGYMISNGSAMGFYLGGNFDMLMIVMIVIIGGGFIHRPALDTSLAAYLTVPVSRKSYAITTLLAYYMLMIGWSIAVSLGGLAMLFSFGYELKFIFIVNYFAVFGVFLLVSLTISAISYFAATLFAGTRVKGMYVLLPIAFYVLSMLAFLGAEVKQLKFIRYLTPYGWFDQQFVFDNGIEQEFLDEISIALGGEAGAPEYNWWDSNQWLPAVLCLAIIAACSIASVLVYRRKKLAI